NTVNTWTINGTNGGNLNGTFTITAVGNLVGGTAADTFKVQTGGSLAGTVDGKGGTDTLDYSGDGTAAVAVSLLDSSATAIFGGAANGFSSIEALTGNGVHTTLTGPNTANTWTVTGADTGNLNSHAFDFAAVGNLVGGTGTDTFALTAGLTTGSLSGS